MVQEVFDSGKKHAKERRQTRFRATPVLYALADSTGVRINADDGDQDLISSPPAPLRLLTSDGRAMGYGNDPRVAIQLAWVQRVNDFWSKHTIDGTMTVARQDGTIYRGPMVQRGFRRDFNLCDGPVSEYRWNLGGRLYSPGEASYQQAGQADRIKMRIDGQSVVELDVSAAQLSALLGPERPDGDLYERGKLAQVPRYIVKTWVTVSLGRGSPLSKWHPGTRAKWEQDGITNEARKPWSAKAVGDLVMGEYPALAHALAQKAPGLWAKLMYLESSAISMGPHWVAFRSSAGQPLGWLAAPTKLHLRTTDWTDRALSGGHGPERHPGRLLRDSLRGVRLVRLPGGARPRRENASTSLLRAPRPIGAPLGCRHPPEGTNHSFMATSGKGPPRGGRGPDASPSPRRWQRRTWSGGDAPPGSCASP